MKLCPKCRRQHVTGTGAPSCAAHRSRRDDDGKLVPCMRPTKGRVCAMHGSGTKARVARGERKDPRTAPVRHGMYDALRNESLRDDIARLSAAEDPTDLREEIAVSRALLRRALDLYAKDKFEGIGVGEMIDKRTDVIGKLAERLSKIELAAAQTYTRSAVDQMRNALIGAVDQVLRTQLGEAGAAIGAKITEEFARILEAAPATGGATS